jgi:hypothetical protein
LAVIVERNGYRHFLYAFTLNVFSIHSRENPLLSFTVDFSITLCIWLRTIKFILLMLLQTGAIEDNAGIKKIIFYRAGK